jgi:hypothetical protein
MEEMRNAYKILARKPDVGVDWRIILEWNLEKQDEEVWAEFI